MAVTNAPETSNLIEVVFNTDNTTIGNILDKPDVFKAVAMMHELLHAEMYRKMLDAVIAAEISSTTLNWANWTNVEFYHDYLDSLENKYFGIFDYFTRYKFDTSEPFDWQHQLIAQHYRDVIKQALEEYDPTLNEEQKEALSWIGLNKSNIVAWQNLDDDVKAEINDLQSQIKNTFPNGCD